MSGGAGTIAGRPAPDARTVAGRRAADAATAAGAGGRGTSARLRWAGRLVRFRRRRRRARTARLRRLVACIRGRSLSPRARRLLVGLVAVGLALAALYQFWFRDSGFVAVDDVRVSGLTTDEAPRIRAALTSAARSMTTLHVDQDRLERVVEAFPVVRDVELRPDFPHGLRIQVIEHHPIAVALTDGGRVPVARDGTVLRAVPMEGRVPEIKSDGTVRGERLEDAAALAAVRVAGAAPAALHRRVGTVARRRKEGLVVSLRDGPELIFGSARRIRAKWIAASRVLSDKAAAGASYVDLRLPGRPAAGGLPAETVAPVAPAGVTSYSAPGADTTLPPAPATTSAPGAATGAPTTVPPAPGTAAAGTGQPAPSTEAPAPAVPGQAAAPTDATGAGGAVAPSP